MSRSSKRKAPSLLVALCLLIAASSACQGAASPSPTAVPTMAPATLTQLVKDILANPDEFEGRSVTLVGYYRGWDLLGEAGSGPPVTRSDWVLRDDSGAIYVQASLAVEGDITLNPGSMAETDRVLQVTGVVRVTAERQPYIEPQRIERVE
jgi:hypothetical protein